MHAPHGGLRGVHVALPLGPGEPVEEGSQEMKLTGWPSLQFPPAMGDVAGGRQITLAQRAGQRKERVTVRAKPGDHQAGVRDPLGDQWPRCKEQVHTFRDDELPDIADDLIVGRVDGPESLRRIAFPAPGGRVCFQARRQRAQPPPGFPGRPRVEPADIDAWPEEPGARGKARHADDLPQALGGVPRADEYAGRPGQTLAGIGRESCGVRPDRVLKRRAVDLDRVGNPAF